MGYSAITEAMLMTAGLGTRLKPFSNRIPKPLLPVMGIPVLQYLLDSLSHAGVKKVVANVHHLAEAARSGIMALEFDGKIRISDESGELLGSGGGVRKALNDFDSETFFIANGDVLCDVNWRELANCHMRLRATRGVQITWAVFPIGPSGEKYREILYDPSTGLMTGLGQHRFGCPFFIGAAVVEKEACMGIPSHGPAEFIPTVLEPAILRKKAGVFLSTEPSTGSWYDQGSAALWYRTHFALIEKLERGRFLTPMSRLWKERIEKANTRIAEGLWIANGSPRPKKITNWAGPCYWDGRSVENQDAPGLFGPYAFLYGAPPKGVADLSFGIGISEDWCSFGPGLRQ